MRKFVVGLLAFSFATSANGATWYYIGASYHGDQGVQHFIDHESTVIDASGIVTNWFEYVYKKPTNGVKVLKVKTSFDCAGRKFWPKTAILFNENGETQTINPVHDWQDVIPDSDDEVIFNVACGRKKPVEAAIPDPVDMSETLFGVAASLRKYDKK